MSTAKAAPKQTAKEQLQKAKPAEKTAGQTYQDQKADPKQDATTKERRERAQRAEVTKSARGKDGVHPFGRRNKLLCAARKAYQRGDSATGKAKASEAYLIAPLSKTEQQQLDKAAQKMEKSR